MVAFPRHSLDCVYHRFVLATGLIFAVLALTGTKSSAEEKDTGYHQHGPPTPLEFETADRPIAKPKAPFTIPPLKSRPEKFFELPEEFLYHDAKYWKFEGLKYGDLFPPVEEVLDLLVLSDGSFIKKMGWFPFLVNVLLERFKENKGEAKQEIILACNKDRPTTLIDPVAQLDRAEAVSKAKVTIDRLPNRNKTQNCLELLDRVAKKLEDEKGRGKIRSLVFVVATEWTFLSNETPNESLRRMLDQGVEEIWLIQLHQEGDGGKAPEFDTQIIQKAGRVDAKIKTLNLPLQKITSANALETSPKLLQAFKKALFGTDKGPPKQK